MKLFKLSLVALLILSFTGCSENLNTSMLEDLKTQTTINSYAQDNWSFTFEYPGIQPLEYKEKTPTDGELLHLMYYDTILPVLEIKQLKNSEFVLTKKYTSEEFFTLAEESFHVSEQSTDESEENTEM